MSASLGRSSRAIAIILLGIAAISAAHAAPTSLHEFYATRPGYGVRCLKDINRRSQ
jgi:hypothetical protein